MNQYFTTNGRMGRLHHFIATNVISFIFTMAGGLLFGISFLLSDTQILGLILFSLFALAGMVVSTMQGVKRLHDMEKSGWMMLLALVPLANIYLGIILLFKKGTDGPNKYGEDPVPVQELTAV
jgi:uncharacterized membrane protein YhaH (DUF805 family)